MSYMFGSASTFNQSLDKWDVSKVTNMYGMFDSASAFNQPIGYWNVARVTSMSYMFHYDSSFNQPIGSWNVSSVTSMTNMFTNVTFSIQNYDNLLLGWSKLPLHHNMLFNAGKSQYSSNAANARQVLTNTFTWTITDDGEYTGVPFSPQFLQAQTGNGFILLSWSLPYTNGGSAITGYNIYVSTNGGKNFSLVTSVGSSTLSYNDTGLANGQLYFFEVTATNSIGMSPDSSEVSATLVIFVTAFSSQTTETTPTGPDFSTGSSKSGKTPGFEVGIFFIAIGFSS